MGYSFSPTYSWPKWPKKLRIRQIKLIPVLSLITANLLPLFGYFWAGWSIFTIILAYWAESAVIGFYNLLKISKTQKKAKTPVKVNGKSKYEKKYFTRFFILHYGAFMFGHLIFIIVLFGSQVISLTNVRYAIAISMVVLLISHGISYNLNYLQRREYQNLAPDQLFLAPYKRIIIMHITIVLAGSAIINSSISDTSMVLFIGLKTLVDLASHIYEHMGVGVFQKLR